MRDGPFDRFIELPELRLHLVDWGGPADAPTVLLLHGGGLTANAGSWNRVAPRIATDFRVLALDQRGHGRSGRPADGDFGFAAVCQDIRSIGDRLGIDRPIVVGQSWGGDVALEYAARHADHVAGIVMIEGGFVGVGDVMTLTQAEENLAPPRWAGLSLAALREEAKRALGEAHDAEVFDVILGSFDVHEDETVSPRLSFDDALEVTRAQWGQDARDLYACVTCPALFLASQPPEPPDPFAERFLLWKRIKAPQIQELMPQARIDWLADSVHDVQLQRPGLVADGIRAFVRMIDL